MAEYLSLIITSSFFCTVVRSLLNDKGAGKTARCIVNVVMLCIIISPVLKSLSFFSNNLAIPVIKDNYSHIIDNKEDDSHTYREWLAKTTASELSADIEESVRTGIGFTVRVECPWHFTGGDVVFDKIKIYTSSDTRYHEKIVNYVKLHYSLDAECFKETE